MLTPFSLGCVHLKTGTEWCIIDSQKRKVAPYGIMGEQQARETLSRLWADKSVEYQNTRPKLAWVPLSGIWWDVVAVD